MNEELEFDDALRALVGEEKPPETSINIIQGDSRHVLREFDDNSVQMILTDPPYFLDGLDNEWDKGQSDSVKGTGSVGGLPVGMKFDTKQGIEFQKFIQPIAHELYRILVPGGFFLSFSQPRLYHRLAVAVEDVGFEIRDLLVWHYTKRAQFKAFTMTHFVERMENLTEKEKRAWLRDLAGRKTPQLRPQFEAMMLAMKPREGTFVENWMKYHVGLIDANKTRDGRAPTTVMDFEKPIKEKYNSHLTVKPVPLLIDLIQLFSSRGQVILDPFLGSGATAIAALRTDRSCVGIEINPEYVKIAERRIKEAGNEH